MNPRSERMTTERTSSLAEKGEFYAEKQENIETIIEEIHLNLEKYSAMEPAEKNKRINRAVGNLVDDKQITLQQAAYILREFGLVDF